MYEKADYGTGGVRHDFLRLSSSCKVAFQYPMQKVLYFNNLFYINDLYMYMCLSRDKLGTKIGVKNAKKNKYRH